MTIAKLRQYCQYCSQKIASLTTLPLFVQDIQLYLPAVGASTATVGASTATAGVATRSRQTSRAGFPV